MAPGGTASPRAGRRGGARRWAGFGIRAASFALLGVASMVVALVVTPRVQVTVLGQDVQVGAVAPRTSSGWSGPGEADLFGEGAVQTVQEFEGPIRPLIVWRQFRPDAAASAFIQTTAEDGRRVIVADTTAVGESLARGWMVYFTRLVVAAGIVGAMTYLLGIAVTILVRGPRARVHSAPHRVWSLALSSALAMGVTAAAATLSVASARSQLAGVSTLADLVGTARLVPPPSATGPQRSDVEIVVIGDSTAAGVGNAPLADPSEADVACQQSKDAYPEVLQSATGWPVENLACASATISQGLLGEQPRRPVTPPPQVGVLKTINTLRVVIVSIGANDIGWADFVKYCYGLPRCDDQASERLIMRRLDMFRLQYAQLLQQLRDLPTSPAVIVTGYYSPFGDSFDCPALADPLAPVQPPPGYGFAADPERGDQATTTRQKVDPLRSVMAQLNSVLTEGATAFGFTSVLPSFEGHELCRDQPWVQGLQDPYPFHPNAAGELAIAAALLPRLVALMPNP